MGYARCLLPESTAELERNWEMVEETSNDELNMSKRVESAVKERHRLYLQEPKTMEEAKSIIAIYR